MQFSWTVSKSFLLTFFTNIMVGFIYTFLVFPFVYQFNSRIEILVISSFASSEGFHQHFSIISKSVYCDFYMKKNVALTLISLLYWNERIVYQFNCHLSYLFRYCSSVASRARFQFSVIRALAVREIPT